MIITRFRQSILWETEEQLWREKLQSEVSPEIKEVKIERVFYVDSNRPLQPDEFEKLHWLLKETFEPERFGDQSRLTGGVFEVGPRIIRLTPQSTNAVSICQACGLTSITRIEQARRFQIVMREGNQLSPSQREQIYALIHDRMTEESYLRPLTSFKIDVKPEPVQIVPVMEEGLAAIRRINETRGLALDEQYMEYIWNYFANELKRDPTDVEISEVGTLDSEHARHLIFALTTFVIDGKEMPHTLFEMIKETNRVWPGKTLVAFKDNAAIIAGHNIKTLQPIDPASPSRFELRPRRYEITYKMETHNHPTGIEPFHGAATGTGGRQRDNAAVGRGGLLIAGSAIYNVSNLHIPGYNLLWEKVYAPHPRRLKTPLEIIIGASNGASRYGNEWGEPVICGSCRSFELQLNEEWFGWHKTFMAAGGVGQIDTDHIEKRESVAGLKVVQIGGDAYRIGLGGAPASSLSTGDQAEELDYDSVQRANAEMQQRCYRLIRACIELGEKNPIESIHDLGGGGDCTAVTELVFPSGARIQLRKIPCGDMTMSVLVLWCNESQERFVLVVPPEHLPILQRIAQREHCPLAVIGEITGDGKLAVEDEWAAPDAPAHQKIPLDLDLGFLLGELPKKRREVQRVQRKLMPLALPSGLTVREALERVLRLMSVGSKHFLTRKVDRSVTGLIAQQQTVGPLQITLADVAVVADSHFAKTGAAMAIGEQPIKEIISPGSSVRLSVAEALTNLVWAPVENFESISLSGNWAWACGQPGEDARLYDAVKGLRDFLLKLGISINVGKDSVSMAAKFNVGGLQKVVKTPGTFVATAYASCPDITKVVTPDIKRPGESKLMYIDLSRGKYRLGGSALAQVFEQVGDESPDVDTNLDIQLFRAGFEAIQELIRGEPLILAGHDRSDGGLITCLLEMAFAGNSGLDINFSDSKTQNIDPFSLLFAEELGVVIEYLPDKEEEIRSVLKEYGLTGCSQEIGKTMVEKKVNVQHGQVTLLSEDMRVLRDIWQETSYQLDRLQANPKCSEAERKAIYNRLGLKFQLAFKPNPTPKRKLAMRDKPKVAILREEGTNGDREMAAAFFAAGFEPWDVTMTDLADGRISLDDFKGVAFCGGFSFADVLDAGKGWAGVIRFNSRIRQEFETFYNRPDTFSLGVCNGCQVMTLLGWVPWPGIESDRHPRYVLNESRIFESRFVAVKVLPSPSIFLKGLEGSILGIWVAHGEGRFFCPDNSILEKIEQQQLAPLRFVNDEGEITEGYPFNPNGSRNGITALCSPDGRHLALMPHPERVFLSWQWPYWPKEWSKLKVSPWLRLFQNAREWSESQKPAR